MGSPTGVPNRESAIESHGNGTLISVWRTGSMAFDIVRVLKSKTCVIVRLSNYRLLKTNTWLRDAWSLAVAKHTPILV